MELTVRETDNKKHLIQLIIQEHFDKYNKGGMQDNKET